jgi:hypothetical protein
MAGGPSTQLVALLRIPGVPVDYLVLLLCHLSRAAQASQAGLGSQPSNSPSGRPRSLSTRRSPRPQCRWQGPYLCFYDTVLMSRASMSRRSLSNRPKMSLSGTALVGLRNDQLRWYCSPPHTLGMLSNSICGLVRLRGPVAVSKMW